MVKLNIGCGTIKKEGYLNVDLYVDADMKFDASERMPFGDGEVNEIYTSHFIEHLSRIELTRFLGESKRILKKDGLLHIICPELITNCKVLIGGKIDLDLFKLYIFGGQEEYGKGEFHKNCFTKESIEKDLKDFKITSIAVDKGILEVKATA